VDIDAVDMVAAAPQLRTVKSFHKSEWAMSNSDALRPALPGDNLKPIRDATWETRLKYFMWVADAVAACPDLSAQLCDAKGMTWHYHPIKFMEYVNKLVMGENGQVAGSAATNIDTNVSLEDGYLTDFVHFAGTPPAAVTDNADGLMVKPFDVSVAAFTYHFTRADIACSAPTPHAPGPTPPQNTKFHLTMLDILENILFHFSGATTQGVQVLDAHGNPTNLGGLITVVRSHLCDGHKTDNAANRGLCVMGTARHLEKHSAGLAADIRPTAANPQDCQNLWNAARFAAGQLNASCTAHAGEASRSDLSASEGTLQQLGISTSPDAVQRKLTAGTALTPAEAAACILHLELTVETISSSWTCWVRRRTKATAVEVDMNFPSPSVMGTFSTQADAQAEMDPSSPAPSQDGGGWRVVIRPNTHASDARVQNGGIVGVYDQFADAENEKEGGSDEPWPEEGSAETN